MKLTSTTGNYIYEEVKEGTVTVHYTDEAGDEIQSPVVNTPLSLEGTAYSTTDNRLETIHTTDGKTYELIPDKTKGQENGQVVEGEIVITYVYEEITGSVVVKYQDKDGNLISGTTTGITKSSVGIAENDVTDVLGGTAYDTRDLRPVTITTAEGKVYQLVLSATKGNEQGV